MNAEHLPRWIWASVTKHFDASKKNLPLYIEGYDRVANPKDGLEFRMDGPYIQEPSKDYFHITIEINVLVTTIKDDRDAHKVVKNTGVAVAAFVNSIPVYKYGDGPDDDRTVLVGCLNLISEGREKIVVSNFGLVQGTNNILQSTVEGHYQMILS